MRWMLFALLVSGCTHPTQPQMRSYGVLLPACVLMCRGASATIEGGSADFGSDVSVLSGRTR